MPLNQIEIFILSKEAKRNKEFQLYQIASYILLSMLAYLVYRGAQPHSWAYYNFYFCYLLSSVAVGYHASGYWFFHLQQLEFTKTLTPKPKEEHT